MIQMKRLFVLSEKERGFTLAEVIVAMAIISFVVLATWRVITSSLHSITRQDQKVKALHISQAHLARLEADTFSRILPESPTVTSGTYDYVVNRFSYQIVGDGDMEYIGDGEIVVQAYNAQLEEWENISSDCTDNGTVDDKPQIRISGHNGETIRIDYEYYHFIDEGGTIPGSDGEELGEGLKERTIELVTSVGDTNANGTPGEKSDILGYDLTDNIPLYPSDYENFNPQTRELTFIDTKEEHSVWIYYLPESDADASGPGGTPDGYLDPTENSIVGVVVGNSYDPVAKTKEITVIEYWKQGGKIQKSEQKAYIMDR